MAIRLCNISTLFVEPDQLHDEHQRDNVCVDDRDDRALPRILEAIHDSVADIDRWQSTLVDIRRLTLSQLAVVNTASNSARFSASCGVPRCWSHCSATLGHRRPFLAAGPKMDIDVPLTVDSFYGLQGPGAPQVETGDGLRQDRDRRSAGWSC
jgi:hypothetical protein